jgi:sugar phosphate isomerase/epimerase
MFDSHFTLTGFADEISADLDEQLEVLAEEEIDHMDLRSVEETNVLDLSEAQVQAIHEKLDDAGVGVSAIGSPIGKIDVTDDFEPHKDRFETALERAREFDAEYIRLFSYWMPEDDDPAAWREEVLRRMEWKAERAEGTGVTLLHENEKDIYGDTPARCRDLLETVNSPNLGAIFDPANFLEVGVHPHPDALLQLIEHVEFLHVKDAVYGERHNIKPAGEGDGDIPAVLDALQQRGFEGFASLEPHLAEQGETGGYSGPEAFTVASQAFKDCLDEAGASYD